MAAHRPTRAWSALVGVLACATLACAAPAPAHAEGVEPETVITSAPPARTTAHTITYTFISDLPDATFRCSLDYAPSEPCTSPKTYADLPEGLHTVLVTAIGPDGTADESPASQRVLIDSVAPDTIITSIQPLRTNATIATIEFASSERGTTACTLDQRPLTPCSSPVPLTGLTPGPHTFTVVSADLVGNLDPTPASTTWTVDAVRWLGPGRVRADGRWRVPLLLGPLDQPARVRVKASRGTLRAATAQTLRVEAGVRTPATIVLDLATRRALRADGRLTITVSAWIGELAARATREVTVLEPREPREPRASRRAKR